MNVIEQDHRRRTKPAQAFTRTELLTVIISLGLLAAVLWPALNRARSLVQRIGCSSNIKQICLSSLMWSRENNNRFPMQVPVADGGTLELVSSGMISPHFLAMSNALSTPKVLRCPEDKLRPMAVKFSDLSDTNVSYFLNVDAMAEVIAPYEGASVLVGDGNITNRAPAGSRLVPITKASTIAWTKDLHSEKGYVGFADGSTGLFANRKAGLPHAVGTDGFAAGATIQLPDGVTNRLAVPTFGSCLRIRTSLQSIASILRVGTPRFAVAVLATLVVSILLCRYRITRNKQFFFITALASAVIVNLMVFVVTFLWGRILMEGWHIFTSAGWEWRSGIINGVGTAVFWGLLFAGLSTFVSILPGLGVAAYYDRRSKKKETLTA